jgi:exosome complex exonuclease RRP6
MYERTEPQPYKPFETTTATFVDTPEALAMMLTELKTAKEIAIDIEHHDNRSYIGLVSLMQISTRDKDWIVDTLKPWRRRLECLNEVFADPSIVKVLHGAFMDIIWLQRDLGLYLVGLFDTFHAARALGYPGASLAFLLDKFINFKAQKQHQLADWRTRPLTNELFEYARADTHFLLYIFDNMKNELVEKSDFSDPEKNKVQDVLAKSKETALQRYEHPTYDRENGQGKGGWHSLISRTPVQFTTPQFAVFRAVHKWRDDVAREEDEGPLFIMPNHAMFSIGRLMPEDRAALYNAVQHISPILKVRADELLSIIADAKATGINGPDLNVTLQRINNMKEAARAEAAAAQAPAPVLVPAAAPIPATTTPSKVAPLKLDELDKLDFKTLRATQSSFWGGLGPMEQRRQMSTLDVNLTVPLPPLTAEIFSDMNGGADPPSPVQEKPTFIAKEDRPEEDERTDIFVVKQLGGRKRKREEDAIDSAPRLDPMHDDEIMLDEDSSDIERRDKAKDKADRKAARKAKKAAEKAKSSKYDEDEPAFDYANAPTVLHAQDKERQDRKAEKRKGKKEKKKTAVGFSPFSKTGDAPKGLGRAPAGQKERAGKSKTFSS